MVDTHKQQRLRAFVVMMSGPECKESIQKMTTEQKITIPVTFLPQGPGAEDVGAYRINPAARNTVVLWKRGTFQKNLVNVEPNTLPTLDRAVDELLK